MSAETIIELAKLALADELFSSAIYRRLAKLYSGKSIRSKLIEMAEMETSHANFWHDFLERRGRDPSSIKASKFKLALYAFTLRLLGLGLTLRLLEASEREAVELYLKMLENQELNSNEKKALKKILEDELVHEQEFAREESKFEEFLNHVREAVLGMNDGLVEVLSVTAGLAGAYGNPYYVALGGLIVGVAGALSMGIGSFASVRAQRQVHEGVLKRISVASRYVAHLFKDRIISYMVRKGYSEEVSKAVAEESSKNHRLLSIVIAEEEYGLREEALEDPIKAGIYTGMFYALGAFVPLLPYFLGLPIFIAIITSLLFAATALALTGFIIGISANLSIRRKMLEMIISGLGSAGVTFIVGRIASLLFGVEVT